MAINHIKYWFAGKLSHWAIKLGYKEHLVYALEDCTPHQATEIIARVAMNGWLNSNKHQYIPVMLYICLYSMGVPEEVLVKWAIAGMGSKQQLSSVKVSVNAKQGIEVIGYHINQNIEPEIKNIYKEITNG